MKYIDISSRKISYYRIFDSSSVLAIALKRTEHFVDDFGEQFCEILEQNQKFIVMPMDLNTIKYELTVLSYTTANDFLVDIKCILHAAKILYGRYMRFESMAVKLNVQL